MMDRDWTDKRIDDFKDRVDQRFDEVDRRFDEVDRRFDKADAKFGRLEAKVDATNRTLWVGIFIAVIVKLVSG